MSLPLNHVETLCAGETLHLLTDAAVFWPREKALLIADLHLGKTATFQRSGIPVPEGGMEEDLRRITRLCDSLAAETLVILGDFFHAPAGRTKSMLATGRRWIESMRGRRIVLVMGNHDVSAGSPPADWEVETHHESLQWGPFTLIHEAQGGEEGFSLSGHLHPSVRLRGKNSRQGLRLPCFWQRGESGLVLPAFGSFTGTHRIQPAAGDRIWGISGGELAAIPSPLWEN